MTAATAKPVSNGHRLVTLAELLELPKPFEDVTLPEMGGVTIRLHALDGRERIELGELARASGDDQKAQDEFMLRVIAACIDGADADAIGRLPASVISRLSVIAYRLAGIGETAILAALADLKATPSAESGTA